MKKLLTILTVVFFTTNLFSQEETTNNAVNKHGVSILPHAGDFAVGIDAGPLFNLAGNLMKINNGYTFNDPMAFNFVSGSSIYGKYFLADNAAVRARFDINMNSETINNFVADDGSTDPEALITDTRVVSGGEVNLGIGYELRRGKGRLQAFYGAEVNLMFGGNTNIAYTYGNAMSTTDSIPTTTIDFENGISTTTSARTTEAKYAGGFGAGLRGFVGVEYFVFPNISFGGEFGWGFMYNSVGEGSVTNEFWDFTTHARDTHTHPIAGSEGFDLGTDNLGGNIYMMIHF
jgi:hypothetical protein